MKTLYWRPSRVSRVELLLIAAVAIGCMSLTEILLTTRRQPNYREKLTAAQLTQRAMDAIKGERLRRGLVISADADPTQSGIIGTLLTPVTSNQGDLHAKQTSVNANFAAVMVHLLKKAGVQEDDAVAVGMSGSFPTINMATLAALKVLRVRPLVIVSAAASQWGANDPNFLWPEMMRYLADVGLFDVLPLAATRGGIDDRAFGMPLDSQRLLDASIARSNTPALSVHSYGDSVAQRMAVYMQAAEGAPIKAYINVGGGATSVGTHVGKHLFAPGLNVTMRPGAPMVDSVMQRFANKGVPIIHMINIAQLAKEYGLPQAPLAPATLGEGSVYSSTVYNTVLAACSLAVILATMTFFIRMNLGVRVLRLGRKK